MYIILFILLYYNVKVTNFNVSYYYYYDTIILCLDKLTI